MSKLGEDADTVRLQYDVSKHSSQTQPPLNLTATELLDKLAQLIPPPRRHRHHYHGVLAPNSKYRSRVTQFANQEFSPAKANSHFTPEANSVLQIKKSSVRWAKLIKKVYEV